jgi:hypothetical protein
MFKNVPCLHGLTDDEASWQTFPIRKGGVSAEKMSQRRPPHCGVKQFLEGIPHEHVEQRF